MTKLGELINGHAFYFDPVDNSFFDSCGTRYSGDFDTAHGAYAEHLADVVRRYLQQRPVIATAPDPFEPPTPRPNPAREPRERTSRWLQRWLLGGERP